MTLFSTNQNNPTNQNEGRQKDTDKDYEVYPSTSGQEKSDQKYSEKRTAVDKEQEEPVHYRHWMDIAYEDYTKSGGMDYLNGKGKPLNIQDGEVMNSVLKEAGFIPPWLELQHRIRDQIKDLIERKPTLDEQALLREIDGINQLIAKLNREVPSPQLQKTRIFPDIIQKQLKHWL